MASDGNNMVPALLGEVRTELRRAFRWINRRRSLVAAVDALRELLPGDSRFGDPMSTAGASASHALGRQAWSLQDGRFSLLSELMLAGLQVADWLEEDVRGVSSGEEQSILFADLRGFSQWALNARESEIARLLRHVDATVTEAVESSSGVVVKRLGDGLMAIFAECEPALEAAFLAIDAVARLRIDDYEPVLRAGLHAGRPYRIGQDYVGLDVNIAARLCEAAPANGVLISGAVSDRLGDRWPATPAPEIHLRGVPDHVSVHVARRRARAGAAA